MQLFLVGFFFFCDISPIRRTSFWTLGDVWVSKPGWVCMADVCSLRFTSSATPANLFMANIGVIFVVSVGKKCNFISFRKRLKYLHSFIMHDTSSGVLMSHLRENVSNILFIFWFWGQDFHI